MCSCDLAAGQLHGMLGRAAQFATRGLTQLLLLPPPSLLLPLPLPLRSRAAVAIEPWYIPFTSAFNGRLSASRRLVLRALTSREDPSRASAIAARHTNFLVGTLTQAGAGRAD